MQSQEMELEDTFGACNTIGIKDSARCSGMKRGGCICNMVTRNLANKHLFMS